MRFKTGSQVEVLVKEMLSDSWRCAEIISGNGHNYNIRYENCSSLTTESILDRVSRKVIRPRPPPVQGVGNWMDGDIAEVLNGSCWSTAVVLKDLGRNLYLVRLLGSCQQLTVYKSDIRLRQLWDGDKWVFIGKGNESYKDINRDFQKLLGDNKRKLDARDDCLTACGNAGFDSSIIDPFRAEKRDYCSHPEVYTAKSQKIRVSEKKGGCQQGIRSPLPEKVDAVAYPRENLGEKYMHASFNNQTARFYEFKRSYNTNGANDCSLAGCLESKDSASDACSVGSCSVASNSPNQLSTCFLARPSQVRDSFCNDAESSCNMGESSYGDAESSYIWGDEDNLSLPLEKDLVAGIHRLELHAYRCTLEALYASGPLSWEQAELLTNLRLSLHISNDEHLMELRNLISTGTCFNV